MSSNESERGAIDLSLSDLASLGTFVSGVAVLISLVYLALQVRQAERNQRGLMQQGRADRLSFMLLQMADSGMADAYFKGVNAPQSLSESELERFLLVCRAAFISGEDSLLQHKAGLLDAAAFGSYAAGVRGQLGGPGLRVAWRLLAHQFRPDYASFMNEQLEQARPQPGRRPAGDLERADPGAAGGRVLTPTTWSPPGLALAGELE